MAVLQNNKTILSVNHGFSYLFLLRKYRPSPAGLLALIALSLVMGWPYFQYISKYDRNIHPKVHHFSVKSSQALGNVQELVQHLLAVHHNLEQSFRANRPPALEDLCELKLVAEDLYPPLRKDMTTLPGTSVICPEHYYGPKSEVGWGILNCTTVKPLHELVTVVLNAQEYVDVKKQTLQLIRDFSASYPRIPLVVVGSGLTAAEVTGGSSSRSITLIPAADASRGYPGRSWNAAFKKVRTQFVLMARDVYRFSSSSSSLQRVLHVLTEVPGVGAVGGALRNVTGHWHVGCFQSDLRNYVLSYQKGYHISRNESMFCDYVDGPFVTYTHLVKSVFLDPHLESDVVFQDFFILLSKTWLTMACPDVMFYANGRMAGGSGILHCDYWLRVAKKYELNRILIHLQWSQVLHKYSCGEVGISCWKKMYYTTYYAIPVCCREEFARALAFWDAFCTEHHFRNYFDSGTCLGAVKMSDVIPWDLDGDAGYPEVNYTFIRQSAPLFVEHGFSLGSFEDPKCCVPTNPDGKKVSYMKLYVAGMYVELWGHWWHPYDSFLYENKSVAIDTRMNIHGVWVNGPPNPGYYVRKRYGRECLRHPQSWIQTGLRTSWEPYETGKFIACLNRGHHACLDSFPTDGNIAFLIPE